VSQNKTNQKLFCVKKILYLDNSNDFFGRNVAGGFIEESTNHEWWDTWLYPFTNDKPSDYTDLLKQADGLILRGQHAALVDLAKEYDIPTILLRSVDNETDDHLTHVNDQAIGKLAKLEIDRLNLYHTAFIGYKGVPWSEQRGVAYLQGHQSIAYLELDENNHHSVESIQTIQNWLETLKKPVGIFAATDTLGVAILLATRLSGLKVPQEVSVISVDNNLLCCNSTNPPLSSIDLHPLQIGRRTAHLLAKKLNLIPPTAPLPDQQLPSLVIRQSSHQITPYLINYKKAIEWIQLNALSGPNVSDVAKACNCSRRALERSFSANSKLTPSAVIRQYRMEAIKPLLRKRDTPIIHLASEANFPDASTFINFIKRQTGKSPRQLREEL